MAKSTVNKTKIASFIGFYNTLQFFKIGSGRQEFSILGPKRCYLKTVDFIFQFFFLLYTVLFFLFVAHAHVL